MQNSNKIYIDIQSLLDVRQSCLIHLMGQDEALTYSYKEAYYLRDLDIFPVNMTEYTELINKANDVALSKATITYMLVVIMSKLAQVEKTNAIEDSKGQCELIVNTYPFAFTDGTLTAFKNALFVKLKVAVKITMVYEPISTWTPGFIKSSGICNFYCYEGSEWLSQHAEHIGGGALKDVRLLFPMLGRAALEKQDIKAIQRAGFKDIFSYTEFLFSQHTKIQFLPVVFYSNQITATAILEIFDEGVKQLDIDKLKPQEPSNGNINNKG